MQLLRVYEIDHEFAPIDIEHASTRIDRLISPVRHAAVRGPLIADVDLAGVKALPVARAGGWWQRGTPFGRSCAASRAWG
jgi:hypothetical protein